MPRIRTGTVGYSYRDWNGVFYPAGCTPRRQLTIYSASFEACELTAFAHQMPDAERVAHLAAQARAELKFFVRVHNVFTHSADYPAALTLAKYFRKAMQPLLDAGRLGGLVAAFPYAFKNARPSREYVAQLAGALGCGTAPSASAPLQVDFRHPSWLTPESIAWLRKNGLALVCVDEPALPGLLPNLAIATASRVLIRLHGRNAEGWWSGNAVTRHDYCYEPDELRELLARYAPLLEDANTDEASFVFGNHWQAQSAFNAKQWAGLVAARSSVGERGDGDGNGNHVTDVAPRPPLALPLDQVRSRVRGALAGLQTSFELPMREHGAAPPLPDDHGDLEER